MRTRALFLVLSLLAAASVTAGAGASEAASTVRRTGYVTVRDGTQLKYTVVTPSGSGRFPTLLEYSGYNPGTHPDEGYIAQFLPKGYAFIGVSLRGTGCSGGVWDFFQPVEATDGYDVIEWIARQRWSNGRVAMVGKSYPGITQLFVAEQRPPHLVAIAPGHSLGDVYRDVAYPGGILNYAFAGLWSFAAQPVPSYQAAFEGVAAGDPICAANMADRPGAVANNPLLQALQHQWDDALHRERSAGYHLDRINVPSFTVLAWQDEQTGGRAIGMLSQFRGPLHAIVTNGDHGMYRTEPALKELERFFDHYVKGKRNGFERTPRVRVWWEAGRDGKRAPAWVTNLAGWPPSNARPARFALGAGGTLGPGATAGAPESYVYAGPTGQGIQNARYSGVTTQPDRYMWEMKPAPGSALTYTTPPLTRPITALGPASADLWLASSAPDTDLQVTITELRPDGQEVYVQKGWLRASHRALNSALSTVTRPIHTHQEADAHDLVPMEPALARVELLPFGHVFRAGSRIRLWVEAPTLLPELWGFAAQPIPSTNFVYHDAEHASALVLSSVPTTSPRRSLPPCNTVIRQPCRAA